MQFIVTHVAFGKRYARVAEIDTPAQAIDLLKRYNAVYFCVNNDQVNQNNSRFRADAEEMEAMHEKVINLHTDGTLMKDIKCVCRDASGYVMVYTEKHERRLFNPNTQRMHFTTRRKWMNRNLERGS